MLYNNDGKAIADEDALKTAAYYNSIGIEARVATEHEDKEKKFDLVVDGVKFDLKRLNKLYCEISKLQLPENEADRVWIILNNDIHKTYSIKKQALVDICAEFLNPNELKDIDVVPEANPLRNERVTYAPGISCGDKLAYFDMSMLSRDDYKVVDMKWLDA